MFDVRIHVLDEKILRTKNIEIAIRLSRVVFIAVILGTISTINKWARDHLFNGSDAFLSTTITILASKALPIYLVVLIFFSYVALKHRNIKIAKRLSVITEMFYSGYFAFFVLTGAINVLVRNTEFITYYLMSLPSLYILHLFRRASKDLAENPELIKSGFFMPFRNASKSASIAFFMGIGMHSKTGFLAKTGLLIAVFGLTWEVIYVSGLLSFNGSTPFVAIREIPIWKFLIFLILLYLVLFVFGALLRYVSRLMYRSSYGQVRLADSRSPILFLRTFRNDQLKMPKSYRTLHQRVVDPIALGTSLEHIIQEETLLLGPVVAIGRPADKVTPLGASRQYVSDEHWRETVTSISRKSGLIFLCLDDSDGVTWELKMLNHLELMGRAIVLFPPDLDSESIDSCSRVFESLYGCTLPDIDKNRKPLGISITSNIITIFIASELSENAYRVVIRESVGLLGLAEL